MVQQLFNNQLIVLKESIINLEQSFKKRVTIVRYLLPIVKNRVKIV